jgi:hypothetical protein
MPSPLVTNPTTNPTLSTTRFEKQRVNTFEFPLLAKYRLPVSRIKPVLEVGPSFRVGGSNNYLTYNLAHDGFTVGGGLEFKLPLLRLSTDLRYTRWARSSSTAEATPNNNQVELLFGFSF